ncbi:MAG: tripartite tricarboxylate transporter substrate binding protein [Hyphomicrobiales bacterium]|nr:tripartite tricarboxylate transporter substrate binding protein [Hyphomicrobiales bacterium]
MPGLTNNKIFGAALLMVLAALAVLAGSDVAGAQSYPNRAIRIVVPTQAGAAQDILARLLQPHLERSLGQPVIVENRSGASTMIGTEAVAKATPDGHTLLIVPTTFTVNAALNSKLNFDLERDFEPITILVKNPLLFAVNAKVPARNLAELVALAKAEPGKLNYGTSGASTQAHLLLEMFSAQAGIKMQHVPYRGGAPAALAIAAGETQLVLLSPLGILPQIQSGLVRAIATGGLARDPNFPDLPTATESGFPGFEAVQWLGLLTTAGTPREIVLRLSAEVNRVLRDPDVAAKLALQGTTAAGSTPEEFKTLIATEIRNWKDTARKAGIKASE